MGQRSIHRSGVSGVIEEISSVWHEWQAGVSYLTPPALASLPVLPPGKKRLVLLVPGLFAGDASMSLLAKWLEFYGYRPISSDLISNVGCPNKTVERLARVLRPRVNQATQKALVIGHSKGGLIGAALGCRYPYLVDAVLTMGTPLCDPFHVRPATGLLVTGLQTIRRIAHEPGTQSGCYTSKCQCPTSRLLQSPNIPPVPITSLYTKRDGIVDWRACLGPGISAREVHCSHSSMPWEKEVIGAIATWLRELEVGLPFAASL